MRLLICTVDENPCQVVNQATMPVSDAFDPAFYGINATSIGHVYAWGFGAVLLCFVLGYVVGVAVSIVRKL